MLRGIVPDRNLPPWLGALCGVALGLFAAAMRLCLSVLLHDQAPYPLFVAAVMVATLLGGVAGGLAAAVVSVLAVDWAIIGGIGRLDLSPAALVGAFTFLAACGLIIAVTRSMTAAVQRERALNRRLSLVGREMEHRVKNVLTIVQTLIRQSARGCASVEELQGNLEERLSALAAAQTLVARSQGGAAPLEPLVREVLAPFGLGRRVMAAGSGQEVEIRAEVAVGLALALHELATNAVKYGALSQEAGQAALAWRLEGDKVRLDWTETGGPRIGPPEREGFGSRLFRGAFPPEEGEIELDFQPEGLCARLWLRPAPAAIRHA